MGRMHEPPVETLLREFVDRGSQAAFTEVVRRGTELVYSTALRRVGGDAHLARDVTQLVFIDLARKARALAPRTVVAGWLHHHTCFRAATMVRSERRRRAREEKAAEMEKSAQEPNHFWPRLEPLLDDALESLSQADRDAVVLRFFAGQDLTSIGRTWGVTDDAAQKRVSRALEKLRSYFARRGVAASSTALATAITTHGVCGAPAGLAATVAHVALLQAAAAAGGSSIAAISATFVMATKIKLAVASAAGVLAVALIVSERRENHRLRAELTAGRLAGTAVSSPAADQVDAKARQSTGPRAAAVAPPANIASTDVEAIIARVIREELWETDHRAFQDILTRIENRDMPTALAYVENNATGQTRRSLRTMLVEHWAKRSPASAASWCRQLPPSADRQQLKEMVSNIWAGTDPETALQLAPSPEGFRQLTLRSAERAEAEAMRLPPGDQRIMAINVIAATKLDQDPRSSVQWLETLSGDDRAAALSATMPELTDADPLAVARYVEQLSPTDRAVHVGRDFAVLWANKDAPAAAKWAATLPPDSPLHQRAVAGVAEIWARSDPAPAAAWISRMAPDRAREAAAKVYVDNVASYDPAAAAALLPKLADNARDAAIVRIAQVWLKTDANAARQWLAQTPLPDAQKQALFDGHLPTP